MNLKEVFQKGVLKSDERTNILARTAKFLAEYDDGNFSFPVQYRVGAPITCRFGLAEGYRMENGRAVWDSVRLHTGVDRAAANRFGQNVVYAPFDFDRSEFYDYGSNHVYGSLIRLYSDEYGFEMRIMHMDPATDINPAAIRLLQGGAPITRNTLLGSCGNYGFSYGAHTHTEIVSLKTTSVVLDELLSLQHGAKVDASYHDDTDNLVRVYREHTYWSDRGEGAILEHYYDSLDKRRVKGVVNDYKYQFEDWFADYEIRTRYSSAKLFNGM